MRHHSALEKRHHHAVYTILVIGFIYTIHLVLPTYSSSSFLSLFASENTLGIIYMTGAAMTALGLLIAPFFLRKIGNYSTMLWLILIQIGLFYGLTHTNNPQYVAIFFVLQSAIVVVMGFCIDVFLEVYSDIKNVGMIRGMYLTTINCAWVLGPLLGTILIGAAEDYRSVYLAALFMLFPLFYLVYKNFPRFKDPHYSHPSFLQTFSHLIKNKNHTRLFIANIILQTFYAWMVVYSPIYLHSTIGLDWSQIGVILTIMLLPFPFLQWPLGKLADRKYGEKEMMIIGFALIGLSTIGLAAISTPSVAAWAFGLFMTRVGAACAEAMIETYFFKTVDAKDSGMLGFFRITRSIAYFTAPLVAGAVLLFTTDQSYMFVALGVLCLFALVPIWGLKDTN